MDVLGSILDKMENPPQTSSKRDIMIKKQQENIKKINEMEKERLKQFRSNIEQQILKLVNDPVMEKYTFDPMEKLYRTIIHDIADKHDLIVYSFGLEDIDRHCVVYKKEFKPSEEELEILRNGADSYERKLKNLQEKMISMDAKNKTKDEQNRHNPSNSYKIKYAHIIGSDSAVAAAKITTPNQQFGMVPSSNKRDVRSIEQILNDNRSKKMKNKQ